MIKGGMEIVDSVAYYECPFAPYGLTEIEAQNCISRLRISVHRDGVWVGLYEGGKLSFQVADVMIGPFDL
jgi:hypothetical protein